MSRHRNVCYSGRETQTPEALKNIVLPEEAIISRLTGQPDVDWYLTNKRLMRIQKNNILKNVEPVMSLSIQGLTFQYKTKTTQRKMALWALCALISVIGILMVTLGYLGSINYTFVTYNMGLSPNIALFVGSVGFAVLLSAIIPPANTISYYQFLHPNLEEADPEKKFWRISETSRNKEALKQFLGDIERTSKNPSSPPE